MEKERGHAISDVIQGLGRSVDLLVQWQSKKEYFASFSFSRAVGCLTAEEGHYVI